jgi:hypothetical protein
LENIRLVQVMQQLRGEREFTIDPVTIDFLVGFHDRLGNPRVGCDVGHQAARIGMMALISAAGRGITGHDGLGVFREGGQYLGQCLLGVFLRRQFLPDVLPRLVVERARHARRRVAVDLREQSAEGGILDRRNVPLQGFPGVLNHGRGSGHLDG